MSTLRSCNWQTWDYQTKLPSSPKVVWQQPPETNLTIIQKDSNTETEKNTLTPEFKKRDGTEAKTSPIQEASHQESGFDTGPFLRNQTKNTTVECPIVTQKNQPEIRETIADTKTNHSGDHNIYLHKITTSQIEKK